MLKRLTLITLAWALILPSSTFAGGRIGYPLEHPRIPRTRISCSEIGSHDLRESIRPTNCELAGYRSERGRETARVAIEGIDWEHWGRASTRGIEGVYTSSGGRVRLTLFRRIGCGDGRTFYSRAVTFNLRTEIWFLVRLPICGEPLPE